MQGMKCIGHVIYTLKNNKEMIMITVSEAKNSVEGRIINIATILNGPIDNSLKDNITDLENDEYIYVDVRTVATNFARDSYDFLIQNEKELAEEIKRQYEEVGQWAVEIVEAEETNEELKARYPEGKVYTLRITIPK